MSERPAPNRALAGDPHLLAPVGLLHGVVVVAVDARGLERMRHRRTQRRQRGVHHLLAVAPGVALGPEHVRHVGVELWATLGQPGEVAVLEDLTLLLGHQACGLDVRRRQLVADATAARVQHDPDPVALVQADLDEVVATAEAAELGGDRRHLALGEVGCRARRHTQGLECGRDTLARALMTLADAGRDAIAQQAVQLAEVVRQLGSAEVGLCGHHAAADVDADRGRQDGVLGRHDAADGCPEAEVRVRHEADRPGQDRQTRRPERLLEGVVVEFAGPGREIRVDLLRHRSCPRLVRAQ